MSQPSTEGTTPASWQERLRASLWRMCKIFLVIVGLFLVLAGYGAYKFMGYSEPGIPWDELTRSREAALPELQTALQSYKEEQGHYPDSLAALTPDYIEQLPYELNPREFSDLNYHLGICEGCEPRIEYKQCLYPWRQCDVTYYVNSGRSETH